LLADCFLPVVPANSPVEMGIELIRRSAGRVPIDKLARLIGMNHSTLERQFKAKVGTTPKVLSRLVRLQNVC
jgi:methylphosphotriester-DNA--protein-cysteine methyltransferase